VSPALTAELCSGRLHSHVRYKRLEKGKFVWPPIVEGALQLTAAQLALLIEGIDWRRTIAPEAPERPAFL
jgi:transposase